MNHKMSGVLRMVPLAATMGTIFFLSHQPGDRLSLPPFPGIDKIGHMMIYGTLAGTVIFAFSARQRDTRPQRVLFLTMVFVCFMVFPMNFISLLSRGGRPVFWMSLRIAAALQWPAYFGQSGAGEFP